jgi:ABC-type polysaccharide/polyol phosphate export permease
MVATRFFSLYFPQVRALTVANLKARYRKTIAGFLWVVINPLMMFGVQSLVFKTFLRLQVNNYSLFLLSGLLPWIFVTSSLEMCTGSILGSGYLLKAFQLPPLVYLFAQLFDNVINFMAAFLLILAPFLVTHGVSVAILLLPVALLLLLGGVIGMTWLLATMQVFFRDTRFVLTFVLSITFFLTPIFYPETYIPEKYRWVAHFNPIYQLIRPFRYVIYQADKGEMLSAFLHSALVASLALMVASFVWRRKKNEIFFNF